MKQMIEFKRKWFRDLKQREPKKYRYVLDHECPDGYMLPSYRDTRSCTSHTCEQCWRKALGEDSQD